MSAPALLEVQNLAKTFTLHQQGGIAIDVLRDLSLIVTAGECVVLTGQSGTGKSTLLRSLYANYKPSSGAIRVRPDADAAWLELTQAEPHQLLALRRSCLGYVSQFLRVIPRVVTLDVVAEPLIEAGVAVNEARNQAAVLLTRLNLPESLWQVPPATFSGGEQQRVNIARCFVKPYPVLLLDEPTASLDAVNRELVVGLINEARERGAAIVGIFHDEDVRAAVATREFDVTAYSPERGNN